MANSNRVTIIIDADGRAYIQGMEKVTGSTKELESQTAPITERLRNHWLEAAAAVYAVQRAIKTAWNMAEISAQYEEQRASLQAMTGQADALIERIQTASNGMISLSAAAMTAGIGIMKGLSAGQLVELAEAAETLSNITGEKVPAAFRQMTEAIALGRERALESSIGIIDLNARYGEQVLRMSEAEKQAARYAIVMAKVREVQAELGPSVTSTSDRMEQFTASLSDLQLTIGAFVIKGAAALLATFQQIAAGAMYAVQGTLKLWELYNRFVAWVEGKEGGDVFAQTAERARLNAEAAGQAAQALTDKAMDSWALLQSRGEAVEKTFKRVKENIALPDAAKKDVEILQTAEDAYQRVEDRILAVVVATEKLGASKERLVELEIIEMMKMGATIDQIERYALARKQQMDNEAAAKQSAAAPEVLMAGQLPAELREVESMNNALLRLQEYYGDRARLFMQAGASELEIIENINAAKLASDEQTDQMRIASASAMVGMMSNTMQSLFVATGSKSKELFLAYKVFATSEAVLSAFLAYSKALAYIPPPFNIPFAKTVLAMGLANAAAIASQGMTSGVGASHSAGGASISTGSPALVAMPTERTEGTPAQNITLIVHTLNPEQVNWDKLMEDNIAPALERFSGTGNNYLNINVRRD